MYILSTRFVCGVVLLAWCLVGVARAAPGQTCVYDYECGNVPYGYCDGGESDCTNTLESFGYYNGSVYYAQACRTNGQLGNYTIKRIPIGGGVPVDVYTRAQLQREGNPNRILGMINSTLFFDIILRQPGRGLKSIDVTKGFNQQEGNIYTNSLPQSALDFDLTSSPKATYLCNYVPGNFSGNYTIERYPIFPADGTVISQGVLYILNSSNSCGVIKRYSDIDLFFTSTVNSISGQTSYIFRGKTTCSNCAPPQPFFSVPERIIDFDVGGGYLFFGTISGVYRINLDGTGKIKLSSNPESGYGVKVINGEVIYNNGMDIRAVDYQGNNNALLSFNQAGKCTCRPGFFGQDCANCTGQIQWQQSDTSRPLCVAYGSNGRPTSCLQDYQCGNPPFTVCYSNTCQCYNANFTGTGCDVCNPPRQKTWSSYGYPSCA